MRTINYWEQFLSTGKIEDYLAYREERKVTGRQNEDEGAGPYAGTGQCYRDHIESRAGRGI